MKSRGAALQCGVDEPAAGTCAVNCCSTPALQACVAHRPTALVATVTCSAAATVIVGLWRERERNRGWQTGGGQCQKARSWHTTCWLAPSSSTATTARRSTPENCDDHEEAEAACAGQEHDAPEHQDARRQVEADHEVYLSRRRVGVQPGCSLSIAAAHDSIAKP